MIKVIKPGFYTTVQDLGRLGYRNYGVPISGAMDGYSSRFANVILGNDSRNAVLEMTMMGPDLQFSKPTQIAISGAIMNSTLNGVPIRLNKIIQINTNDILSFGKCIEGARTYLAISGGFITDKVLGSRSFFGGITKSLCLRAGDTLNYLNNTIKPSNQNAHLSFNKTLFANKILSVTKGPEFHKLSKACADSLFTKDFKVSKRNSRMAYQLEPLLPNELKPILTAPVLPGTIQLTPSGQLIVLMRDCQTTGGYPRILQLTEKSINILSQKKTDNTLIFRLKAY